MWEVDLQRGQGPGHGAWAELRDWMPPKGKEGACDPQACLWCIDYKPLVIDG